MDSGEYKSIKTRSQEIGNSKGINNSESLAPGGACGLCAHGDRHIGGGQAELAGGGGEEVEGTEHDVAPRRESFAVSECQCVGHRSDECLLAR